MNCRIIDHQIICRQEGRYIGWPTIARLPDGELVTVFSGDRDAHIDPFGKSMLVRSSDNGGTWSKAELINDTPLDDRDTGLCATPGGTLIMSWFTSHYTDEKYMKNCPEAETARWRRRLRAVTDADLEKWASRDVGQDQRYELGRFTRRSTDGGRTWEDPVRVSGTAPHGPNGLADGTLIFVGQGSLLDRPERASSITVSTSVDDGRSWDQISTIPMFPPYPGEDPDGMAYLCEPHVIETAPGALLMTARYEEKPRTQEYNRLWQAFSTDRGVTWTPPAETPLVGKPPHLTRLNDGRLLVSYGYRHKPYGERACLSADGGKTWDTENEIILRDDAPTHDLGYPASVQLPDGTIVTVYYQQRADGEKTCLMATRWRLT